MPRRLLALFLPFVLALTACTPTQIQAWVAWHESDPPAAEAFAQRMGNAYQATPVESPPSAEYAPAGMDNCAEMSWYRVDAGLPARFESLGWRESNCRNEVTSGTGCCVGYWQLSNVIWRDHRMVDKLAACGATWLNVRGDNPGAEKRQACAAKALYDVMGFSPWSL